MSKGFVSMIALIWFSSIVTIILSASQIINNYLLTLENLKTIKNEAKIEIMAVAQAKRLLSDMEEYNYCDYIGNCDVCWYFYDDYTIIEIDYQDYKKTLAFSYDFACDCLLDIGVKVDK